jgi:HTH-type transcriptional regulator/antitoxin HigA
MRPPFEAQEVTMDIRPIKTDADYQAALSHVAALMDAQLNTPAGDALDIFTTLIAAYEEQHYPILPPDPVEALVYWMDTRDLTRRDLEPLLGSRARVAEILNRRRTLTLDMIRRLHAGLGIPAEILIQPYSTTKATT